jgi:hypothetical protein
MLNALVGQCLDHHFRAAHFRHDPLPLSFPPSSHVGVEEIKKGLKSPCFSRIATFRGWIIHPRRCAFLRE